MKHGGFILRATYVAAIMLSADTSGATAAEGIGNPSVSPASRASMSSRPPQPHVPVTWRAASSNAVKCRVGSSKETRALHLCDGQEHISVMARHDRLSRVASIGGRLGLSIQHNPATIDVIDRHLMESRGFIRSNEAVAAAPGVTWGGAPGNPGQFVMRGFLSNQVNVLHDGIFMGPTTMVARPLNSFNLDSVQILQGPASVLFGQGSVGGTIDTILRKPDLSKSRVNIETGYGSFNSVNAGIGVTALLAQGLAARIDASRTSSDGYAYGASPHSNDITASILWRPNKSFSARLSTDFMTDKLSTYYGAPLVPLAQTGGRVGGLLTSSEGLGVTRATLWKNYNVRNPVANATSAIPTLHLTWKPSRRVKLNNRAYFVYAKRRWENAENYQYISDPGIVDEAGNAVAAGQLARDRFYVYQSQHQVGDTLSLTYKDRLLSRPNTFVLGADAYYLRFIRSAGASATPYTDHISLDQTNHGAFGPFAGQYPFSKSPATITDAAIFFEDVLRIVPRLRLIVGARYDWLMLDRQNFLPGGIYDPASSFNATYNPFNYRAGLVYDLTDRVSLYGVYTTAEDPPNGNIFRATRANFTGLSHSQQGEVGVKATLWDGRVETTLSFYDIIRNNILVATGQNAVANAGEQTSRGIEWAGHLRLDPHWRFDANLAYTDARYGNGFEPSPGVDASNKQVPDVPAMTANLWGVWSHPRELPIELGAGMQYVSARKGNYTNTLTLNDYALVNVYAAWDIYRGIRLYGRIDNLGNKKFVQWADTSYPTEVILGTPRSFSFNMQAHF